MELGGLQKFSLMDYPDRVSCVVFTAGCNLRCPYCHNSELINLRGSRLTEEEFFNFLEDRKDVLDAVVVSGGEPTLHEDLPEFLENIKEKGFLVKLDTNGTRPEMLEKLVEEGLVDYVAMDIKTSLENYGEVGGEEFVDRVRKSIGLVKDFENHEFRTTLAPGVVCEKDMNKISELVSGADRYFVQEFRSESVLDPDIKLETGNISPSRAISRVEGVKTCEVRKS